MCQYFQNVSILTDQCVQIEDLRMCKCDQFGRFCSAQSGHINVFGEMESGNTFRGVQYENINY